MDDGAVERARERVEQRADGAALDTLLVRAREQVEALVAATAGLEQSVHEAVRSEAQPVGRNLAEIRGLMNQVLRRLSALESDLLAERNARVDDLALLVDLVSSGWEGVDARLGRIEAVVNRLDHGHEDRGAIVYRMDDRRPDAATS
jgi:hypothetical protein